MTVGMRVVCIDGKFPIDASKYYVAFPIEGVVYTIRSVSLGCNWRGEAGEVCVHLREIINPKSSKSPYPERGFNAERFRPLEEITEHEEKQDFDLISV